MHIGLVGCLLFRIMQVKLGLHLSSSDPFSGLQDPASQAPQLSMKEEVVVFKQMSFLGHKQD